jgi:hypothetical protein
MMSRATSLRVVISRRALSFIARPSACRRPPGEPSGRELGEVGREVDSGEPAVQLDRGEPGRAAPGERIEHDSAWLAPGRDAPERKVDRVGGEARPGVGEGGIDHTSPGLAFSGLG